MATNFIINAGLNSEKTITASKYVHQDGLWTFLDSAGRQIYSLAAGKLVTVERSGEKD